MMTGRTKRVYVVYNKITKAKIETNEKYLIQWLARGFEVLEIKDEEIEEEEDTDTEDNTLYLDI